MKHLKVLIFADMAKKTLLFLCLYELFRLNDKSKMINDKPVYDLQGRRVVKPTRGLYIKDGKKIMVK